MSRRYLDIDYVGNNVLLGTTRTYCLCLRIVQCCEENTVETCLSPTVGNKTIWIFRHLLLLRKSSQRYRWLTSRTHTSIVQSLVSLSVFVHYSRPFPDSRLLRGVIDSNGRYSEPIECSSQIGEKLIKFPGP